MSKKKDSNESLQVFIRCRPFLESETSVESSPLEVHPEVNKILVRDTGTERNAVKTFTFDGVFGPESSQAAIFNEVAAPLLQEVIKGFNCTIFAYGQTGTGKTFTIEGGRSSNVGNGDIDPLAGIIPRSMGYLFRELGNYEFKYEMRVSFLELYNEEIFDLLSKSEDVTKLKIYDNVSQKRSVVVQGLQSVTIKSMQDVYAILDKGCSKRRKAATLLNKMSSRSHSVFTVTIYISEKSATEERTKTGKLNLVDLAGSENIGRSGAIEQRAREAGNINQSLLALGRVITSLSERAVHIPYRESKLTRLLQDSLGGQTKTTLIATISPSDAHLEETINTLEYALRAKNIAIKPEMNSQVTTTALTKEYIEKIIALEKELKSYCDADGKRYVAEENMRNWELRLSEKRDEASALISETEEMKEQILTLDLKINEENKMLLEKEKKLDERRKRTEELIRQIQQERQEQEFSQSMLSILKPVCSDLHQELHKKLEAKAKLESEVNQMKEKATKAADERKSLHSKLQNLRADHHRKKEKFKAFQEELQESIKKLHEDANSLKSMCNNCISGVQHSLESSCSIYEEELAQISVVVSEIEKANSSFQENLESVLNDYKCLKMKCLSEFAETSVRTSDSTEPEVLTLILPECETLLKSISVSMQEWSQHFNFKMKECEQMLHVYLSDQTNLLTSMQESANEFQLMQNEDFTKYQCIISEAIASGDTRKKKWEDCVNAIERAILSMDTMCSEFISEEIDRNITAHSELEKYTKLGSQTIEKLLSVCEDSLGAVDSTHQGYFKEASCSELENVEENVKSLLSKYSEVTKACSESTKLPEVTKNMGEFCADTKESIKTEEFKSDELPDATTCFDMFAELMEKNVDMYTSLMKENERKVDAFAVEQTASLKKFREISEQLHSNLTSGLSNHIDSIQTGTQFLQEETTVEECRNESDDKKLHKDQESVGGTFNFLVQSLNLHEDKFETGCDKRCSYCENKIHESESGSSEAFQTLPTEEKKHTSLSVGTRKMFGPGRTSFFRIRSPVKKDKGKSKPVPKTNLPLLSVKDLIHELFDYHSEDEDREMNK